MAGKSQCFTALALLALLCLSPAAFTAEPISEPHTLTLENGDLLRGKMSSFEAGSVGWTRSDGIGVMKFAADKVQAIDLGIVTTPPTKGNLPARIRLRNGDMLDGNIVSLDASQLKFESACAGTLTIPRTLLRSIAPQSTNVVTVFDGISSTNGWTFADVSSVGDEAGYWSYQPGAFVATKAASIARDLKMPDQTTMEFDINWRGTLNLAIAIFTDSLKPIKLTSKETEPPFATFYSLQINTLSISLLNVSQTEPLRNMGQIIAPSLNQKNEAHITIHASKERRTVCLLIDGVLVKQWNEGLLLAQGTGVRFVHQGQGSIRLSNLRLRQWDGRIEETSANPHRGPDEAVITVMGEKLIGKLLSYDEASVQLQTGQTPFKIALDRVQRIEFSGLDVTTTAPGKARLVRARLGNAGILTFVLNSWKDGVAKITLPGIGAAELKTESLQQLEFLDAAGEKTATNAN